MLRLDLSGFILLPNGDHMPCEDIEKRLQDLREQKRNLEDAIPMIQGSGLQHAQERLAELERQIHEEEINLQECKDSPPSPRPFIGRVDSITCIKDSNREIGKEEPYLVIATVDMRETVNVTLPVAVQIPKPAVNTFLVGPWSGVKSHSTRWTDELDERNKPPFWDLNSRAEIIGSPQDVIFLVALLESDNSGPHAVRGVVNNALELSIVNNLQRPYDVLVSALVVDMKGAIQLSTASGLAFPKTADELIGDVQQLILTADDIGRINMFGNHSKLLTFQRLQDLVGSGMTTT